LVRLERSRYPGRWLRSRREGVDQQGADEAMCGIVGILGKNPVALDVVEALRRLEYRGYDSAGVATLEDGQLTRRRAEGKLRNLEAKLSKEPLSGLIGIGHTRWATHGKPTAANAHPHATDRLAVVHNGIIENFRELRAELQSEGCVFESETDTEVVAHLVTREMKRGLSPVDAVGIVLPRLRGAFALAFLFQGEEDLLIGARLGSPLAVGIGEGEMYLGSDALALAPFTNLIAYLDEGDWAVLHRNAVEFRDRDGRIVQRAAQRVAAGAALVDKGNHRHFMAKEIHEQPEVVSHTLTAYLDMAEGKVRLPFTAPFDWREVSRISIAACGTAYLAGLTARYWFEALARLPVDIDVASEFRYREPPLSPSNGLAMVVSQSGETADTLASLRYAKAQNQTILSVVNVPTSTIARESHAVAPTIAGPEIGVASTKAFTCQLTALASLAVAAGRARGIIDETREQELVQELIRLPGLMAQALKTELQIERMAQKLSRSKDVLYLGRGTSYPLALEGALKLKEISYIHAEGYAAGELKHGPIALIDEDMPVIVVAPFDHLFEKTASNMQEVAARGGRIILITDERGAHEAGVTPEATIIMPTMSPTFSAMVYAVPIQLIAYHIALFMGKDVDQPRNLAKSVTVE
jgi:glucosamine--fructose-6-phosphate aminotransferase (isomerizing)